MSTKHDHVKQLREEKLSSEHISRRFESVNGLIQSLCISMKLCEVYILNLESEIWQSNWGIPVATVMLYNLNNFPGLCSYNARLFNNDVTVSGVSYWRRREFSSYARLHRGRISHPIHCLMWDVIIHHCPVFSGGLTKPPLGIGWESGGGGFSTSRDIISYVIYLFKCLIFYAWRKL